MEHNYTTFAEDAAFLLSYTPMLILQEATGKAKVAVSTNLQARVMTSTANGDKGRSYGWINRELFESGDTLAHINPFGGEERFWLGPEGGQFALFFEAGKEFDLGDWQTPALIDTEPFELISHTDQSASYHKGAQLTNYSGFTFEFEIERTISVLSMEELGETLGIELPASVNGMAYRTDNSLKNTGNEAWTKEKGLMSIWLLGMFNPSPQTTVIIPFKEGEEGELGPIVNDNYFGKVPPEKLKVKDGFVYFSGDGSLRSKVGLSPYRSTDLLGSYDAESQVLTIVQFSKPEGVTDYVNSLWEIQEAPYKGDVINSYNDGPPSPGAKPLGPFYELETSSPAFALKPGESGFHQQTTWHFEGPEEDLNLISQQVLGVDLQTVKSIFSLD